MADYTYSEIMRMQNDAIKRVEEMQKKARQTAGLEKENIKPTDEIPAEPPRRVPMPKDYLDNLKEYAAKLSSDEEEEEEKNTDHTKEENKVKKMFPNKTENIFNDLSIDEDKTLLLSLILLLSEEKGDELLIMALIYMLT